MATSQTRCGHISRRSHDQQRGVALILWAKHFLPDNAGMKFSSPKISSIRSAVAHLDVVDRHRDYAVVGQHERAMCRRGHIIDSHAEC